MKVAFPVTVRELVHAHVGKVAVVMGGGESLLRDVPLCPADAIYLSANQHGAKLLAEQYSDRRCSYIVALDGIREKVVPWGLPIIGRYLWADYRILKFRIRGGGQDSAMAAAWVARLMGCSPIIVTGVDCYSGGTYWHDPHAPSHGRSTPPKQHAANWLEFVRRWPAMYRTVSRGPLSQAAIPDLYDQEEPCKPPPPRDELVRDVSGVYCEVLRDGVQFRRQVLNRGVTLEIDRDEARGLVERKQVRIVGVYAAP